MLLNATFFGPLEIAYQEQWEPEGGFLRLWLGLWVMGAVSLSVCLFRLTRRRLHDAGFSGRWLGLLLVPVLGWIVLAGLLARPSVAKLTVFDEY